MKTTEAARWHSMRVMGSSASHCWATPQALCDSLDAEFGFTLDPCPLRPVEQAGMPLFGTDGLSISWAGQRVYCNPPYGRPIPLWLAKAPEADLAVYLLPARTDTRWWHKWAPLASEIRFVKGRLRFGDGKYPAPFPSVILVFGSP